MSDIQQIELTIEQAKAAIKKATTVRRLCESKDFKEVIEKGYFQENAARLVMLRAEPNMQEAEQQDSILKEIDAIGQLRQHILTILMLGNNAQKALVDNEEMLDDLISDKGE